MTVPKQGLPPRSPFLTKEVKPAIVIANEETEENAIRESTQNYHSFGDRDPTERQSIEPVEPDSNVKPALG